MDDLLSIGEFSARCGLSAKVLRTHAAAGLLVPAAVDRLTGYRYYLAEQVGTADLIATLRRADVSLAEIAALLVDPDEQRLDALEVAFEAGVAERRRAFAEARLRLSTVPGREPTTTSTTTSTKETRMLTITTGGATDVGRVRATNQDALRSGPSLAAVADGFGAAGEEAAAEVMTTLCNAFVSDPSIAGLGEGFEAANRAVVALAQQQDSGTTLAAVGVVEVEGDLRLVAGNVGDSRVYLFRGGAMRQVTEDHSRIAEAVRRGDLDPSDAVDHPDRHILTRALGVGADVRYDLFEVAVEAGDRVLLCTDGLVHELPDDGMAHVLASDLTAEGAAQELVRLGVEHGGADNITAVVLHID